MSTASCQFRKHNVVEILAYENNTSMPLIERGQLSGGANAGMNPRSHLL